MAANKTTIQQLQAGQLIVSIPKAIAHALGWDKGTRIAWTIRDGEVVVKREEEGGR